MLIYEIFDLPPRPDTAEATNGQLFGIELEIEHASFVWGTDYFNAVEDGSLRNGGVEYVSCPLSKETMYVALTEFFNTYRVDEHNYSDRTSIHVHADCSKLTLDQIKSIFLLYQVTENILFEWIGNDRKNNIFCVPWSQTGLSYNIVNDMDHFIKIANNDRNKYTALNFVPLQTLGTIEFRHMHGHNDINKIMQWINLIDSFFKVVETVSFDNVLDKVVKLNTNSEYDMFLTWLFNDYAGILKGIPNYKLWLEEGVLAAKYAVINANKNKTKTKLQFNSEEMLARLGGVLVRRYAQLRPVFDEWHEEQVDPQPFPETEEESF